MMGHVITCMGDRLWAGKSSRYVTSHLGQLSLPSLQGKVNRLPAYLAEVKARHVYLCDPIWQVTLCRSVMGFL